MHEYEKVKTEFRNAVAQFNALVGRGEYGKAAQAAGRAGRAAARMRAATAASVGGPSHDWSADAAKWAEMQDWARRLARGA